MNNATIQNLPISVANVSKYKKKARKFKKEFNEYQEACISIILIIGQCHISLIKHPVSCFRDAYSFTLSTQLNLFE